MSFKSKVTDWKKIINIRLEKETTNLKVGDGKRKSREKLRKLRKKILNKKGNK